MKKFLEEAWQKFQKKSTLFKAFCAFLFILYLGILAICIIPLKVDATTPGDISEAVGSIEDVTNPKLITIDPDLSNREKYRDIFTVSVYSRENMSVFEYLVMRHDRNSEVSIGKPLERVFFTADEELKTNIGFKIQSIQTSLLVSYTRAREDFLAGRETGEDAEKVHLDAEYKGEYLIYIPNKLLGCENDLKNGDVITGYNSVPLENSDSLRQILDDIFTGLKYNDISLKDYAENKLSLKNSSSDERTRVHSLFNEINTFLDDSDFDPGSFSVLRNVNVYEEGLFDSTIKKAQSDEETSFSPSLKLLYYLYTHLLLNTEKDQMGRINGDVSFPYYAINYANSYPKITLNKDNNVGPSGGLMQTLAIYNAITAKDWTKGWRIIGTGAIGSNGAALPIGAVKQKVVTAHLFKADYFIVPTSNYADALDKYMEIDGHKKKPGIACGVVPVMSFDALLKFLDGLGVRKR